MLVILATVTQARTIGTMACSSITSFSSILPENRHGGKRREASGGLAEYRCRMVAQTLLLPSMARSYAFCCPTNISAVARKRVRLASGSSDQRSSNRAKSGSFSVFFGRPP
jgi:hypothetical protein